MGKVSDMHDRMDEMGVHEMDWRNLHLRVQQDHHDLWEDYEECFAHDPYSFAVNEIGRAIHHALSLKNPMSETEQTVLLRMALFCCLSDSDLWNSEAFTFHIDQQTDDETIAMAKGMRSTLDNYLQRTTGGNS